VVSDNKLLAAAKAVPAHVVGDGTDYSRISSTTNLDPKKRVYEMYSSGK
jgi:cyanophycin synthetase